MWLFSFPPDDFFPDFSSFFVILLFSYIPSYKTFNFYEFGSSNVFLLCFFLWNSHKEGSLSLSHLSSTGLYWVCCSVKKQNGKKSENAWKVRPREQIRLAVGTQVLQWMQWVAFCEALLVAVGAQLSFSHTWSQGLLSKATTPLNLGTVGELQESTWPLSCLWAQPEPATLPGPWAGHVPPAWAGRAPWPLSWLHVVCCSVFLNLLWMPHVRGHHREMPLLSSCWRRLKLRVRQRSGPSTVLLIHNHHWRLFRNLTLYSDCFLCKRSVCRAPQDKSIKRRH